MNVLGGYPLDQGDPNVAGGIGFSLIAILLIIFMVLYFLWFILTEELPKLVEIRTFGDLKKWLSTLGEDFLVVLFFGSILGLIAFILNKIGL